MDKFEVGQRVEISDPDQIWSSATICTIKRLTSSTLVSVRYDGWDTDWNEELRTITKRLAPIYTHTGRVKCLVQLPFKRKSKSKKGGKKGKVDNYSLWPCVLNVRMPTDKRGEAHLSTEKNVFVEPYRPDLLPVYLKRDWKNGGMWLDTSRIFTWEYIGNDKPRHADALNTAMKTIEDEKQGFAEFPNNFQQSYAMARDDPTVPGMLNEYPFEKGSLLVKKLRIFKSNGRWSKNHLVDLTGWKDSIVNFDALEKIIIPVKVVKIEASASKADDSVNINANDAASIAATGSNDGSKKRKAESLPTVKSSRARIPTQTLRDQEEGQELALAIEASLQSSMSMCTTGTGNGHDISTEEAAALSTIAPYAAGDAGIPTGIEIRESIYPGYNITESTVDGSAGEKIWIATVMVRGNEVQLGKYPSQTEAKRAIDEHYEKSKRKVVRTRKRSGSKTTYSKEQVASNSSTEVEEDDGRVGHLPYPMEYYGHDNDFEDENIGDIDDDDTTRSDERSLLSAPKTTRTRTRTTRQSVTVDDSSLSKEEARDADVSAISVEQAVSMAYRGGNQIQDTGFSLHDWALVVINDTEKAKWRGKFQEMKKARLENDRERRNVAVSKR